MFETITELFHSIFPTKDTDTLAKEIIEANSLSFLDRSKICEVIYSTLTSTNLTEYTITDKNAIDICDSVFKVPSEETIDYLIGRGYFITVEDGPTDKSRIIKLNDKDSRIYQIFSISSTIRQEKLKTIADNYATVKKIVEEQLATQKNTLITSKRIYLDLSLFGDLEYDFLKSVMNEVLLPYRLFSFKENDTQIGIGVL